MRKAKNMNKKNSNFLFFFVLSLLVIGAMRCGISTKLELDPESQEFYETARLIMTKLETDIFKHLPDKSSRDEFIQDFWKKRDPDPDTDVNEFKEEFFSRIEYANERFNEGIPGWKTDRGRIYIYFGAPDKIEAMPMLNEPELKGYMLWVYYRYNFAVEFIDKGNNSYTLNPYSGIYGNLTDAIEQAQFGIIHQQEDIAQKFMDFDLEFDQNEEEIIVSIPVKGLIFPEEEGVLKADFEFEFFIYPKDGSEKKEFHDVRQLEVTEEEILQMEEIIFDFSFALSPGEYYFDVIIISKPAMSKTRKIFKVRI